MNNNNKIVKVNINRSQSSYEILINTGLLKNIINYIPERVSNICIISHPSIYSLYGSIIESTLRSQGYNVFNYLLPEGENSKSWENTQKALEYLLDNNFDRRSSLIALGGGVIGDFTGFVASIFYRGINFIQIPTSLLSMVDSSVGGKTAVNLHNYGKNLIGAFYQPYKVLIDLDVLESLPKLEWQNGLAEVLKYSFLKQDNARFFSWLEDNSNSLKEYNINNQELISQMIETCVQSKRDIVEQDEKESTGLRALLNLGHTFAHAFESLSKYSIPHGLAVSIGMRFAIQLSYNAQFITQTVSNRLISLLEKYSLPVSLSGEHKFTSESIIECFKFDKKTENNVFNFVLPVGDISNCKNISNIDSAILQRSIEECL